MKRTGKGTEFAVPDEQELPGTQMSEPGSSRPSARVFGLSEARSLDSSLVAGANASAGIAVMGTSPVPASAGGFSEPSVAPASTVDRLQLMIQSEVQSLSRAKAEQVSVVLRPDTQTEIQLRLHVQNGLVEAHARCERGNVEALNAQWSQLQQSLLECGVKLGPLQQANGLDWSPRLPNALEFGNSMTRHGQKQAQHSGVWSKGHPELPAAKHSAPQRSPVRVSAEHLLEIWA
jgi:hypothetical protein